MPDIETIMYVVLALVLLALAALFLGRIGLVTAKKLRKQRTERDAPAKIATLEAERDQLRAEHAMLSRKLEMRLDDLKTKLAEQTAEVSRNRNRIDHMVKQVEKREQILAERDAQIATFHEQIGPLEEELENRTQSVQELKQQFSDAEATIATLRDEITALEGKNSFKDSQIKALRDELDGMPDVPEFSAQAAEAHNRVEKRIAELTALSARIEQQRAALGADQPKTKSKSKSARKTKPKARPGRKAAAKSSKAKATDTADVDKQVDEDAPKTQTGRKRKPSVRKTASRKAPAKKGGGRMSSTDTPAPKLSVVGKINSELEAKIDSAEQESRDLQSELAKLDDIWTEKLDELQKAAGRGTKAHEIISDNVNGKSDGKGEDDDGNEETEPSGRSFQNVISLAARIRALQRKTAD